MKRIRIEIERRMGSDAFAALRKGMIERATIDMSTYDPAGCAIGNERLDDRNLTLMIREHDRRLDAIERGLDMRK